MAVDRPGETQPDPVSVIAMVDSGAYRTSFPLQIAYDLGIQPDELVEDEHGGVGVGSQFRVWTTTTDIHAGIAFFEPAPDGTERPWGEGFSLSPAFTEHNAFLLGRADFFAAFDVTFENGSEGPLFHIDQAE
jgi:hypothetical protein